MKHFLRLFLKLFRWSLFKRKPVNSSETKAPANIQAPVNKRPLSEVELALIRHNPIVPSQMQKAVAAAGTSAVADVSAKSADLSKSQISVNFASVNFPARLKEIFESHINISISQEHKL